MTEVSTYMRGGPEWNKGLSRVCDSRSRTVSLRREMKGRLTQLDVLYLSEGDHKVTGRDRVGCVGDVKGVFRVTVKLS